MDKKIYNHLINFSEQNPFIRGLVPWTGFKQVPVNYHRNDRTKGKTGYSFFKMLNFTIDGILSFSNLPIKLAYITCLFSIFLLIVLLFYTLLIPAHEAQLEMVWEPDHLHQKSLEVYP